MLTTPSTHRRILRYNGSDHKPNITGFDMRKFLKASTPPRYDPWERKCVT